eukprot:4515711-Amphidinium_carterae.2
MGGQSNCESICDWGHVNDACEAHLQAATFCAIKTNIDGDLTILASTCARSQHLPVGKKGESDYPQS